MLRVWSQCYWIESLFSGYYLLVIISVIAGESVCCWWSIFNVYPFVVRWSTPHFFSKFALVRSSQFFWKWNELSISIISIEGFSTINNSFWATPISNRIHGAGIYANIWAILMINVAIYSSTMDPSWLWGNRTYPASPFIRVHPDGYPPINVSAWKMSIYNDRSLFSRSLGKSWFSLGKSSPFMAARFRLVKYDNLPG